MPPHATAMSWGGVASILPMYQAHGQTKVATAADIRFIFFNKINGLFYTVS